MCIIKHWQSPCISISTRRTNEQCQYLSIKHSLPAISIQRNSIFSYKYKNLNGIYSLVSRLFGSLAAVELYLLLGWMDRWKKSVNAKCVCFFFFTSFIFNVLSFVSVLSRRSCWLDFVVDDTEYERFFFLSLFHFCCDLNCFLLNSFCWLTVSHFFFVSFYQCLRCLCVHHWNGKFIVSSFFAASICSISSNQTQCYSNMNFSILRTISCVDFYIDFAISFIQSSKVPAGFSTGLHAST